MDSKEKCKKVDEDFDDILDYVGSSGKYQRKMLYYVLVPICFCIGYDICQLLFQVAVPKYWCHVPGRENTTLSAQEWMNLTIPRKNGSEEYSSCSRYSVEWTNDANSTFIVKDEIQSCSDGWDFDKRQFATTVATTHEWYCDKEIYSPNVLTVNMAGNAVGTFILPVMADMIGRRPIFYAMLVIHLVFTFAYIWVPNYGLHLTFRFLRALIELTIYLIPHITVLEFMAPEDRAKATTISWIGWMVGMCATSLIAWLLPNWQHLALSSCVPAVLGFAYWNHFPESPRWLLSKMRIRESADVLMKVSEMNGKEDVTRVELETRLQKLSNLKKEEVSFFVAFRYPNIRLRSILLFIISFCMYTVYGVTLFGINVLPDNQFLSHLILSLSELPSNFLGLAMVNYLGRRVTCYATFFVTALICVVSLFCTHNQWLMMIMVAMIKLFDTTALFVLYVLTAEIYPTAIRSTGLGLMAVWGLVAMAVGPGILNSGMGPTFQYWVMLVLSLLSILAALPMPETLGLPLPQTFQEAEDLGSGRPLTTWVNHWNQHKFQGRRTSQIDASATKEELEKLKSIS